MGHRVLALVVAIVLLGAPVATAICQATCATNIAHSHSCLPQTPASESAMNGITHSCGHLSDMPVGRDEARQELVAPAAIVPMLTMAVALVEIPRATTVAIDSGPPSFVVLTLPLRL